MASIKPAEVSKILRQQLEGIQTGVELEEVGTVLEVGDGIARVYGLDRVMSNELLEFPNGVFGLALNLEEESVGAVLLGESRLVKEGDLVKVKVLEVDKQGRIRLSMKAVEEGEGVNA